MIKSNCNGCRALSYIDMNYKCRLGYKLITRPIFDDVPEGIPQEECPKPLTYDRYFTIVQDRETEERDKQRSEG